MTVFPFDRDSDAARVVESDGDDAMRTALLAAPSESPLETALGTLDGTIAGEPLTTAYLARLVTEHRADLERRAARILGNPSDASDVVQEALMRLLVAAPDLQSYDHAVGYLRKTVTNLSLNVLRATGRRAPLVSLDANSTTSDLPWDLADASPTHDDNLIAAEDAAVVRLALAKLSPQQRTALVLWDGEGMSTTEVAERLGVSESRVRKIVFKARRSLVTSLQTTIVDEERGLTAADMLSDSVQKALRGMQKAGKAAMAILLVVTGIALFLNARTPQNEIALPTPSASTPVPAVSPEVSASPSITADVADATTDAPTTAPAAAATAMSREESLESIDAVLDDAAAALTRVDEFTAAFFDTIAWPGVDADGIPLSAWVSDGFSTGEAAVANVDSVIGLDGTITTTSDVFTLSSGAALLLGQTLSVDVLSGSVDYEMSPSVRVNGTWYDLRIADQQVIVKRLANREMLLTIWAIPNTRVSAAEYGLSVGRDLRGVPAAIGIRIHTTEVGQPIFGQSIVLLGAAGGTR